ncbi:MAG: hypothetical protein WC954_06750 [Sphaerochaeta sp.]
MAQIEVKAQTKVEGQSEPLQGSIMYDFGDTLSEAIERFGEKVVFDLYLAQAKIQCQAAMRRVMVDGGDVQQVAKAWMPGTSLEKRVDPQAAVLQFLANATPEEKAEFLAKIKNLAKK